MSSSSATPGGIIDFVKFLNEGKDVPAGPQAIPSTLRGKATEEGTPVEKMGEVEVSLQWNTGYGENVMSFANNIYTPEGGMHLEGFRTGAYSRRSMTMRAGRAFSRRRNPTSRATTFARASPPSSPSSFPDPQFEGQTKAKLGSSYMRSLTNKVVSDGLAEYLEEHPKQARTIV